MSNSFVDIVRTANKNNWCTTPFCTTCIAREYRQALKEFGGELGGGLANALSELNPSELTVESNWENALLTAIIDLPFSLQLEGILETWLEKSEENIKFTDFVLFKVIRNISTKSEIRIKWVDRCISLAVRSQNFSLIESLLLVIGKKLSSNKNLYKLRKTMENHHVK